MNAHCTELRQANLGDLFRVGMRQLVSGVSIVATRAEDGPKGFLATSVSSVALEPEPCLLVCVNRSVSSHDALLRVGFFSVNLLAEPHAEMARRFSSSALRAERFAGDEWTTAATGAPVYRGALANFDCELATSIEVQTHTIMIGRVVAVQTSDAPVDPLIYYDGGFDAVRAA